MEAHNAASSGSLLCALYCAKMGAKRARNKVGKVSCPVEARRAGTNCLALLMFDDLKAI